MTNQDKNEIFEYLVAAEITNTMPGVANFLAMLYYGGIALIAIASGVILLLGAFGIL